MKHNDKRREYGRQRGLLRKVNGRDDARSVAEKRQRINSIKLASGCIECGWAEHPAGLHFDHLPGTEKLFNIGGAVSRAWSNTLTEMAKCEIVCANCHAIRTASRRGK